MNNCDDALFCTFDIDLGYVLRVGKCRQHCTQHNQRFIDAGKGYGTPLGSIDYHVGTVTKKTYLQRFGGLMQLELHTVAIAVLQRRTDHFPDQVTANPGPTPESISEDLTFSLFLLFILNVLPVTTAAHAEQRTSGGCAMK